MTVYVVMSVCDYEYGCTEIAGQNCPGCHRRDGGESGSHSDPFPLRTQLSALSSVLSSLFTSKELISFIIFAP